VTVRFCVLKVKLSLWITICEYYIFILLYTTAHFIRNVLLTSTNRSCRRRYSVHRPRLPHLPSHSMDEYRHTTCATYQTDITE